MVPLSPLVRGAGAGGAAGACWGATGIGPPYWICCMLAIGGWIWIIGSWIC